MGNEEEKRDLEHHMFHIGETLVETNDMLNNRLSEIQNELKDLNHAIYLLVQELHEVRKERGL